MIRHGAGVTTFRRAASGIDHDLAVFVAPAEPVKVSLLTLTNRGESPRRLSVFSYSEWVLGPPQADQQRHVVTELDGESGALLARNLYGGDFSGRVAFVSRQREPRIGDRRPVVLHRPQRLLVAPGGAVAVSSCPIASAPGSIRAPPCMSP